MESVDENSYSRTFSSPQGLGWFKARFQPQSHSFSVEIQVTHTSELYWVVNNIRRVLDLDLDIQQVESALSAAGITPLQLCSGIRIPGIWNTFEAGCRAILGQQISVKAAIKLLNTLVKKLDHRQNSELYFPTPAQVSQSDLAFLGMPQKRRQTLIDFAHMMRTPQEPEQWLSIKGIGPWTVDYGQLRGQSQPDICLDKDLVIKQQLEQYPITPQAAQPWRSYLTFQLWSLA